METKQMSFDMNNFAKWLSGELKERHWPVAKLSKVSGVHPNTIRNYLANRCEPSFYNVVMLVRALGYRLEVVKNDNK